MVLLEMQSISLLLYYAEKLVVARIPRTTLKHKALSFSLKCLQITV